MARRSTQALDRWGRFMQEMMLTRIVDNFLCYVAESLAAIFTHRPEMLRSGQQVRLDFILGFEDMSSLLAAVAERRVEQLAYKGLDELADVLQNADAVPRR